MFAILGSIAGAVMTFVLGLFRTKDERDKERDAGEKLGRAEAAGAANAKELDDAKQAVDASRAAGAADDAGGVRERKPGDRPWDPNGVG